MKKVIYLVALAVLSFYSCDSKPSKESNKTESLKAKTETVVNNKVQENNGGAVHLTKEMFLENVWDFNNSPQEWNFKGDKPAIIDFYADWCGPCKTAAPILEEISHEYAGKVNVYKINTEKERELASVFGIRSIPAFLYIPVEGKPVMMSGIGRSIEETKNMFIENIGKYLLTTN